MKRSLDDQFKVRLFSITMVVTVQEVAESMILGLTGDREVQCGGCRCFVDVFELQPFHGYDRREREAYTVQLCEECWEGMYEGE